MRASVWRKSVLVIMLLASLILAIRPQCCYISVHSRNYWFRTVGASATYQPGDIRESEIPRNSIRVTVQDSRGTHTTIRIERLNRELVWEQFRIHEEIPVTISSQFWLVPNTAIGDVLLDLFGMYSATQYIITKLITDFTSQYPSVSWLGQQQVIVTTSLYADRTWNVTYDSSSLLAVKLQYYDPGSIATYSLFETNIELEPIEILPRIQIAFIQLAALFCTLIIIGYLYLRLLRRRRRPSPSSQRAFF